MENADKINQSYKKIIKQNLFKNKQKTAIL